VVVVIKVVAIDRISCSDGSRNKLTQNIDRIGDIGTSDNKINKAPIKMTIACQILERITIRSAKLDIELHRSFNGALIMSRPRFFKN
jgi:hypothetical protein